MNFIKKGFTLAEILMTLTIIGVISALTTPVLVHKVSDAKVPPKLFRFKATFDNASELLLRDEDSECILGILDIEKANGNNGERTEVLGRKLQKFMDINPVADFYDTFDMDGSTQRPAVTVRQFANKDGMYFRFYISSQLPIIDDNFADIPSNQKIGQLYLDINGPQRPNVVSRDIFWFDIYNDGTLRPYGTAGSVRSQQQNNNIRYWFNVNGRHGCDEVNIQDPQTCAGSIFDNGRIIYKRKR